MQEAFGDPQEESNKFHELQKLKPWNNYFNFIEEFKKLSHPITLPQHYFSDTLQKALPPHIRGYMLPHRGKNLENQCHKLQEYGAEVNKNHHQNKKETNINVSQRTWLRDEEYNRQKSTRSCLKCGQKRH
jgi:hypothetical protein